MRRDDTLLQDQDRFDQRRQSADGLEMANVGFDGAHNGLSRPLLLAAKYTANRLNLQRITSLRASPVSLNVMSLAGI